MPDYDRLLVCLLLIVFYILVFPNHGTTKLTLKRFENCQPSDYYEALFNVTWKTVGGTQYLDATIILKSPLDNTLWNNVSVNIFTGGKYVYLLSISDRKVCDSYHKYLGEFMYEMERRVRLIPRMCPIPQGTYHLHDFPVNSDKIVSLVNFPFGNLLFDNMLYHRINNKVYSCFVYEIENRLR